MSSVCSPVGIEYGVKLTPNSQLITHIRRAKMPRCQRQVCSGITITTGKSNLTTGRIAAARGQLMVFARCRQCASYLIYASLGSPESKSQTAFRSVQPFLRSSSQCPDTLQLGRSSTLKIAPFHGASGRPSITWFLWPTHVLNPNGISIGSAVFAGLTTVTDRDRPRHSVCNGSEFGLIINHL